jgi:serine/threonine-protein kinase
MRYWALVDSRPGTKQDDGGMPDQTTEVSVIESKRDQLTEISVIDVPRLRTPRVSDQITNVFAAEETSQPPTRLPFGGSFGGSGRLRDTEVVNIVDFEIIPGTTLGEYQIHGKLGEGGMGTVFSAIHPMIGKRAAIKVLKRQFCEDPVLVERFIDEARVVNQIGHPNIVDIFAFGEMPDGRRFFAMEWLKGETLRERLRRGPCSLTQMARLIGSLSRALESAHDKGVIHRDLKPENIFLADIAHEEPLVKLLDFGVAKLANDKGRMAQTEKGQILGTPMYIAPEQASNANEVSFASDVYSLGAIAFECLTGRPPFLARSTVEMVTAHITETPVTPSSLVPETPEQIDQLVLEMLAKDPKERPSLSHVRQLLEQVKDPAELFDQPTITARPKYKASEKTDPSGRPVPSRDESFVAVRFSSGAHNPLIRPTSPDTEKIRKQAPRIQERILLIALIAVVTTMIALFATGIIRV